MQDTTTLDSNLYEEFEELNDLYLRKAIEISYALDCEVSTS